MLHRHERVEILCHNAHVHEDAERGFGRRRRIDVWWGGLQANGGLMMLLAYLLQTSREWQGTEMHVKLVVGSEAAAEGARRNLEGVLGRMRITAETHVMIDAGRSFPEVLRESSRDADLVLLGVAEPGEDFSEYYGRLHLLAEGLPTVAFVLAAQDLDFSAVLL